MSHIYPVRQGLAKLVRYEKDVDTQIVTAYPTINIPLTGTGVKQQSCLMSSTTVSLSSICCNILDGYPLELPCRYANKQACYTEVYLVSNLPLERRTVHCRTRSLKRGPPSCDCITLCGFLPLMEAIRIIPPTIISGSV